MPSTRRNPITVHETTDRVLTGLRLYLPSGETALVSSPPNLHKAGETMWFPRMVSGVSLLATMLVVQGCGGSGDSSVTGVTGATGVNTVASVSVSPSSGALSVGGTLQLVASVWNDVGNALLGQSVAWNSSSSSVATVSSTGLVTGASAGTATISGSVSGKSGTTTITVSSPAFTLAASPATASIAPGGTASLSVTIVRSGGFEGAVTITAEGLPTGVTTSGVVISAGTTSGTVLLSASASAPNSAATTVTLRARATGLTDRTTTAALTVAATNATFVGAFTVPAYRVFGTSDATGATCFFDVTWTGATLTLTYPSLSAGSLATIRVTGRRISTPLTPSASGPGGTSLCSSGDATHTGTSSFTAALPAANGSTTYSVNSNSAVSETAAFSGTANGASTTITGTLTFTYFGAGRGGATGSTTVTLTRQ